jgi:hypothetical protein
MNGKSAQMAKIFMIAMYYATAVAFRSVPVSRRLALISTPRWHSNRLSYPKRSRLGSRLELPPSTWSARSLSLRRTERLVSDEDDEGANVVSPYAYPQTRWQRPSFQCVVLTQNFKA